MDSMNYALKNGIILDGTKEMIPQNGKMILIKNGIIDKITEEDRVPGGYEVIDLQGRYIMPGLINLHVHLPASGKPKKKQTDPVKAVKLFTGNALMRKIALKLCESYAKTELLSGVTTIRTVGGIEDFDSRIRDLIAAGKVCGPRILASNKAVSVPEGHMVNSLAYEAHTPGEAAAYVRKIAKDQPDLIKLMITGGVMDAKVKGEPGELKMSPEMVKAACDEAHSLGFQVAAHVESPQGVKVALENGVDTIEHGAKPTEEILTLFQKRQAALVATLSPAVPYAMFDRELSHITETEQYNGAVVLEGIKDCAKMCLQRGIPVGLGTDVGCAYVTHYGMWRELQFFHQMCGVSKGFALYTATLGNAEIAGIADKVGEVKEGKLAELIVTEENPLEDLRTLGDVRMVFFGDRVIKNPKIKKMPEVERRLDEVMSGGGMTP